MYWYKNERIIRAWLGGDDLIHLFGSKRFVGFRCGIQPVHRVCNFGDVHAFFAQLYLWCLNVAVTATFGSIRRKRGRAYEEFSDHVL